VGEGQQAAGDDPSAVQLDHPRADPLPRRERPGRGALADADRLAAAQEVAGQERLAGHDAAHLVEAHHRAAQRLHVTPVGDRLLPAAAPEVVVDDVAPVRLERAAEEILERAAPDRHGVVVAEDVLDVRELDARLLAGGADVQPQRLLERLASFVASKPLDQTCE
jgi:hypothetical protein